MTKNKIMSDDELQKLKAQISENLSYDRHMLLMKFPFAGNLLMRMNLIPVRDKRCMTMCTDGKNIFVNCAFYTDLTIAERRFVLAHELFHCVMLHLVRLQTRNPELFNIATDMEVNYILEQQQNGKLFKAPKGLLFPPKRMYGKSAEVIYEWLLRKMKQNAKAQSKSTSSNRGSSNSSGSSTGSDDSDSDVGDNKANSDTTKDGKKSGKLEGQFDKHTYANETDDAKNITSQTSDDSNQSGNGQLGNVITDKYGEVGYDKDFKPKMSSDFAEQMREAVIAEAQRTQRLKGEMPAGLAGILEQITKPQFNWKEQLSKFVTQCYNGNRRWLPPSRRHVYNEIYLQSRRSEKLKCTILLDTSGSCWHDLSRFFGELFGIIKSFGQYEVNVIQCDMEVHSCVKYDDTNPFQFNELKKLEIKGSGGSDFRPAFKHIREHNIETDVMIAMTDGYIDVPMNAPPYPVMWVLTNDRSKDFCSYGTKLIFKPDDENSYTQLSS